MVEIFAMISKYVTIKYELLNNWEYSIVSLYTLSYFVPHLSYLHLIQIILYYIITKVNLSCCNLM